MKFIFVVNIKVSRLELENIFAENFNNYHITFEALNQAF